MEKHQEKTIEVLNSPALCDSPVLKNNGKDIRVRVAELIQFCREAKKDRKNFLTHRATSVEYNRTVASKLEKFVDTIGVHLPTAVGLDGLAKAAADVKHGVESKYRAITIHQIKKEEIPSKAKFEIPVPIYAELNYLRIVEYLGKLGPALEHNLPMFVGIPKQLQINELNGVHGVLLFTTDVKGMYFLIGVKKQKVDDQTEKTIVEPVLAFDLQALNV